MLCDVGLSNKNIIYLDDLDIKDIVDCLLGLVDVVEFDMSSWQDQRHMLSKEDYMLFIKGGNYACPMMGADLHSYDEVLLDETLDVPTI